MVKLTLGLLSLKQPRIIVGLLIVIVLFVIESRSQSGNLLPNTGICNHA